MNKNLIAVGLIILFARCSIIDDSDITDPNADLTLVSIDINQTTQDGSRDLGGGTAQSGTDGKISSILWSISGDDFAFRTGTRTSAIGGNQNIYSSDISGTIRTFFDTWDTKDRITRMHNEIGGMVFEVYTFEYDFQGRLTKMSTIYGDDNDPCFDDIPDTCTGQVLIINDSIVYLSGEDKFDYIKRRVFDGTIEQFQEAFYVGYGDFNNNPNNITEDEIGIVALKRFGIMNGVPVPESDIFDSFSPSRRSAYINQGYRHWSVNFDNSNFSIFGNSRFTPFVQGKFVVSVNIQDVRFFDDGSTTGGDQNRLPDIYYFHPFLLFPAFFKNGADLSSLYFNDWWILNQEVDPSFTFKQNREIVISFNYTK